MTCTTKDLDSIAICLEPSLYDDGASDDDEIDAERVDGQKTTLKTTDAYAMAVTARKQASPAPDNDIEVFIESFKNYDKLVFSVAVLSKFFKWLRDKRYVKPGISQNDLNVAEGSLIRYVQRYAFSDTMEQLNLSGRLSGTQRLFRLEPFLDDDGTIWV